MGPGTSPPTRAPQRLSNASVTLESLCSFPARQPLAAGGGGVTWGSWDTCWQ